MSIASPRMTTGRKVYLIIGDLVAIFNGSRGMPSTFIALPLAAVATLLTDIFFRSFLENPKDKKNFSEMAFLQTFPESMKAGVERPLTVTGKYLQ